MKVAQMTTTALSLPVASRGWNINPILVQLVTEEGLEAFGLAYAMQDHGVKSLRACIEDLKETVIGQDIFRWAETWQKLWQNTGRMGHGGYGINALSAIDSALWSLQAKALGMPLSRLLGGYREEIPVYASHLLWRHHSIDQLQKDAASLVEQGFRTVKMNMGDKPASVELERFKAVREAVGDDINIMIDVNSLWTLPQAIRIGHQLEPYNVYWLEDPVASRDVDDLAQLVETLDIPIATGETFSTKYGFRPLIEKRAADILIIDLQAVGGVTEWMKVAAIAQAWNLPVVNHLFHGFLAHLVAAVPNGLQLEYMDWWEAIYQQPPEIKNGYFKIPDKPGLGLELDPRAIQKYEVK